MSRIAINKHWSGLFVLAGISTAVLLVLMGFSVVAAVPPVPDSNKLACDSPEARQFDFWIGEWNVRNLSPGVDADSEWVDDGMATNRVYSVVNGCGIVEHWEGIRKGRHIYGFSVRAFNEETQKWVLVLNWPSPNRPRFGILRGVFRHGRGDFFSKFQNAEGNDVLNRYSFADVAHDSFRWDAAISPDEGKTWETNWIMEFSRRDPMNDTPLFNGVQRSHLRCDMEQAREFDPWLGNWRGANGNASISVQSFGILEGCAVMDFVTVRTGDSERKLFFVRSYVPRIEKWAQFSLDDSGMGFNREVGDVGAEGVVLAPPVRDDGPKMMERFRWQRSDDGTVRWGAERSTDGGKTWNAGPVFDLERIP